MRGSFAPDANGGSRKMLSRDQAFIQSQQVDRVGPLTVGAAHSLNNLLAIIAGDRETLKQRTGNKNPMRRQMQAAPHAVHRGAGLAQCSVRVAPGQRLDPVKADVNEVALDVADLLQLSVVDRIHVVPCLCDEHWPAMSTRTGKAALGRKGSQLTGQSAGRSLPGIRYYPARADPRCPLHPGSAQPTRWVLLRRLSGRRTSVHSPSANRPHLQE